MLSIALVMFWGIPSFFAGGVVAMDVVEKVKATIRTLLGINTDTDEE